jgi:hypothetical protein
MMKCVDYGAFGGRAMKNVLVGVKLDGLLKELGALNTYIKMGDKGAVANRVRVVRNINVLVASCKELPTMEEMYN